jgi:hypothetical protein
MNTAICVAGGRAPPEESRRTPHNLIGSTQLANLLLEILDPLWLAHGHPGTHAIINLGLLDPAPD